MPRKQAVSLKRHLCLNNAFCGISHAKFLNSNKHATEESKFQHCKLGELFLYRLYTPPTPLKSHCDHAGCRTPAASRTTVQVTCAGVGWALTVELQHLSIRYRRSNEAHRSAENYCKPRANSGKAPLFSTSLKGQLGN